MTEKKAMVKFGRDSLKELKTVAELTQLKDKLALDTKWIARSTLVFAVQ